MKASLHVLKPTPLSNLFLLLGLFFQFVFCSSQTTIFSMEPNVPERSEIAFGVGSPIRIVSENGKKSCDIRWAILVFNLAVVYALALASAKAVVKTTGSRRVTTAYGKVALVMIGLTFFVSIVISKVYWGYFFSPPKLLSEVGAMAHVTDVVPFQIAPDDSSHRNFVPDLTCSLSERLAAGKEPGEYNFEERILVELDRRHLLPAAWSTNSSILPELYGLIHKSGALVASSIGYNSATQLNGIAIDGNDATGRRVLILGFTGGQLSNDHHPYYEMLFRGDDGSAKLSFVRAQHYFYDAAGIEGMEWYVFWIMLLVPGIVLGFVLYTGILRIRRRNLNQLEPITSS